MKKWNVVLDKDSLSKFLLPEQISPRYKQQREEQSNRLILLDSHRIVFSDSLLSILETSNPELHAIFRDWILAENYVDGPIKVEESECTSFNSWLNKVCMNPLINDWQLVYINTHDVQPIIDIHPESTRNWSSLLTQELSNKLLRDSKLCNISIPINMDCLLFMDWFNELFENESEIYIFDQFICNIKGLNVFKKYYANSLSGKTVHLYVNQYQWDEANRSEPNYRTRWKQLALNKNIHIIFHFSRDPEHDRYIFLSNDIIINIGQGLDFLDGETNKTQSTSFHIWQGKEKTPTSICLEHPYSNGNVSFP